MTLDITLNENHIIAERRQKLAKLREQGLAFPNNFKPLDRAAEINTKYANKTKEELVEAKISVTIAGRIMLKRIMGKASFITLQDGQSNIQVYITREKIGEKAYEDFKHYDIGDILGINGILFITKTGELTINATSIQLITKSLRPLPDKFHGLTDQELRYRQRYVDLIMNNEVKQTFIKRSQIIKSIRDSMLEEGYLEVETPMMHPIPGGASAKSFTTYHNALDMKLYLRIAPELYLKRLLIGGFDRVFEINRNFRNEGLSTRHNPEFTMIEFYESYADYKRMMELTEKIIKNAALNAIGKLKFEYQGREVDLESPFAQLTIVEAINQYNPIYTIEQLNDREYMLTEVSKLTRETIAPDTTLGVLQLLMFEENTESKLWNPTYIIDYPIEISPLARQFDNNPNITERYELFIVGRELANGFSELNDPEDQSQRFLAQAQLLASGDDEAMHYDADYIRALEYGMPHAGGCGIGIDRLVMLLTNSSSIRDVILFPQMRMTD